MPNISKIKIGNTVYNIHDTEAATKINQLQTDVHVANSYCEEIDSDANYEALERKRGILPVNTIQVRNPGTYTLKSGFFNLLILNADGAVTITTDKYLENSTDYPSGTCLYRGTMVFGKLPSSITWNLPNLQWPELSPSPSSFQTMHWYEFRLRMIKLSSSSKDWTYLGKFEVM